MKNNNGAVIKRLTNRSLKSNTKRNLFIMIAITLTTLLLGFVFSIGMSLTETKKMEEIRLTGTVAQAAVGHPTVSQLEKLKNLDYVQVVGTNNNVAFVKNTPQMGKISLTLHYFDKTEWKILRAPACTDITGSYPQRENEIMVSRGTLEVLGINNPTIGMEIPLTYYIESDNDGTLIQENFRLSGWFTSYALIQSRYNADTIFASEELSKKYGKSIEKDGSASIVFDNASRALEYCEKLKLDLGVSEDQPVALNQRYNENNNSTGTTLIASFAVIIFLIFTGYLLIYNVMYISVSRDVRFYGLLKTLGTTPKQIKRIVIGQIMRLCIIGIPIGAIMALLLSLIAVPVSIAKLGATSTGAVVSFSPLIYIGAAFFSLFTALFSAYKPARKAANISPIEAQKYTGVNPVGSHNYRSTHGKPYKMAFRNIFRDRKRTLLVLLSLFLGITSFLTITTLVSSMGVSNYVDTMFDGDFILKNNTVLDAGGPKQKFDPAFIEKLKGLPGFEELQLTTQELMRIDYSADAAIAEYAAGIYKQNGVENITQEEIQEKFRGFIVGVDDRFLMKLKETLDKSIDVDAFERGEFALVATDNPNLFSNIHDLAIIPLRMSESGFEELSGSGKVKIPIGGFVSYSFYKGGMAPTVFVSNGLMTQLYQDPIISEINLNVSKGYEQKAFDLLKQVTGGDHEISQTSKLETLKELNNAITVLYVLGGGISLIIALIGILNFVNVMSTGIMVRKHELATLESVGMSKKQVRKLLVAEGLGYAVITLLLVFTIGNMITLGFFYLFRQQAAYAIFTYPFLPVSIVSLIIIAICAITPEVVYSIISKSTIVERLRETE